MTKQERKDLLEKMLTANDNMSPENPYHALVYADCLVKLCGNFEYKHAEAIWQYEFERERAEATNKQWGKYVLDLEQPDSHSEMLYNLMTNQENIANSLHEASEKAYDYFLGIASDNEKLGSMDV